MSPLRKKGRVAGTARHALRSWLVADDGKGCVAVSVQCERCGGVGRVSVGLPVALNEVHTFVLAAKEKLRGTCG